MSSTEDSTPAGLSAMGGTFAERAAFRASQGQVGAKVVHEDVVEDKAVTRSTTKARKTATKKG